MLTVLPNRPYLPMIVLILLFVLFCSSLSHIAVEASSSSSSPSSVSLSSSSSTVPNYLGVQASNNVGSSLGISVWNVNSVASFAPPNIVQIFWVTDPTDHMIGQIISVNATALTITVNVYSISGPTGILWTPWGFTLLALGPSSSSAATSASASASASTSTTASASASTSSNPLALTSSPFSSGFSLSSSLAGDYTGVVASDNVSSTMGITVWHVNKVASFSTGNIVQIAWMVDPNDFMTGTITAVDPVALTITVDVFSIAGPTGILWTPWQFTLVALSSGSSSSGTIVSSGASAASEITLLGTSVSLILSSIIMGMGALLQA